MLNIGKITVVKIEISLLSENTSDKYACIHVAIPSRRKPCITTASIMIIKPDDISKVFRDTLSASSAASSWFSGAQTAYRSFS